MKQYYGVESATNSLSSMNMDTMNHGIPMMVTTPVIKTIQNQYWLRLLFITLFSEQYLHPTDSSQTTIHPTVPITVQWTVLQKSEGTNHYSWTVTVTVHQTVPRQHHPVYYLLSAEKEIHLRVKVFHLPWFQQSPEESKASFSLYKEPSASFFSRSLLEQHLRIGLLQ